MKEQIAPPAYSPSSAPPAAAPPLPLGYTQVSASQGTAYLVRSDGAVDRTTGRGKVSQQILPPPGLGKYIAASSEQYFCLLLTDTGSIMRTKWRGKTSIRDLINPPPGMMYTAVSAGPVASYYIRSDGAALRARCGGVVSTEIVATPVGPASSSSPAAPVKYTAASAGLCHSYLLRDDGRVDKVKGGVVIATLEPKGVPKGGAVRFVGFSDQLTVSSDKESHGPHANYLLRSDGLVERIAGVSTDHQILTASVMTNINGGGSSDGKAYLAASAGDYCSYLIRGDGVCCRTVTKGKIHTEMNPTPGTKYLQAAAGQWASYILRSDGAVARTVTRGTINCMMIPQPLNPKLVRMCQGTAQAPPSYAATDASPEKSGLATAGHSIVPASA